MAWTSIHFFFLDHRPILQVYGFLKFNTTNSNEYAAYFVTTYQLVRFIINNIYKVAKVNLLITFKAFKT